MNKILKKMTKIKKRKAILIFGPAGSGKTSTAKRIAKNKGWTYFSEDEYWAKLKKGKPSEELRTNEEQKIIWKKVLKDIKNAFNKKHNVVLEFLVYEDPPKPLLFYKKELLKLKAEILVKILKPEFKIILDRRMKRNAIHDKSFFKRRKNNDPCVEYLQLEVLGSNHIKKKWIIKDTGYTIEEVYQKYFSEFIEGKEYLKK
jgi:adenylate kinase family enzyme